ncbi:MAG: hypothetical protein QXQ61_04590, partial [Candidatus Bathyarchaeia archaeon]
NCPEVPDAEIGSTIYAGLEGYPIAKTALSTFLPGFLADYVDDFIPSQYHYTCFRFKFPEYEKYLAIAKGDFEGLKFYRIQIKGVRVIFGWTILELSKVEEANVLECIAYIFGRVIPFGNMIFKIQSYAFLAMVPVLLIGTICLAAKSKMTESEAQKQFLPKKEESVTYAKPSILIKPVGISEIRRELEELKIRHVIGELSIEEYNERKAQLNEILRICQQQLLKEHQTIKKQEEELKTRMLVGEVSQEVYKEKIETMETNLRKIEQELEAIKNLIN